MADRELVQKLKQGAGAWNAWRKGEGAKVRRPDLREAGLVRADLNGADLSQADLGRAVLAGARLMMANLNRADLTDANLHGAVFARAHLVGANLSRAVLNGGSLNGADANGANLESAHLWSASLIGVDLRAANLRAANLREADLRHANLSEADLNEANLSQASLIDAQLDRANITAAHLWETQHGGWSIEGIICQNAFWDREGKEPTEYGEGEFERIFAEKPRILLRYPGGISPMDLIALPLVVERLQVEYPSSVLQIRSMQNDAGGASVTITVEDLENCGAEVFTAEVEALRRDLLTIQHRLRSEESLRLVFETKYQAMVQDVLPILLERAVPKREFNIGRVTAPMIIEGATMHKGDTYNIQGQAGAVGPGSQAQGNTFQQIQGGGIDLPKLAEELGRLREAMKNAAIGTREQDKAIGAVTEAEEAAAKGDGPAALRYLKSAGTWTLKIAEEVGTAMLVEVLKQAL